MNVFFPKLVRIALAALLGTSAFTPWVAEAGAVAPRLEYQLVPGSDILSRTGQSYLPTTQTQYGSFEGLYRDADVANIQPSEAASIINQLPANAPLVVGRYAVASSRLVVDVYKVERSGTQTGVYRASFTPAHGQLWAHAGTYKAPNETGPGADPFARFVDSDPQAFANVSFEAVEVILGHAMRYVSSPVAVLAVATPRTEQRMETTRNAYLRKNVTVRVNSYLEPKWYVAAPPSFQSGGSSAAICLHPSGSCASTPYLVAPAMVTFQEWQGGTMPDTLTHLGEDVFTDSSSFRFDDVVVAAYVYTFATSGMQTAMRNSGGVTDSFTSALQSYNVGGATPAMPAAASEAGLYAGLPAVLNQGSLGAVQDQFRISAGTGLSNQPSPVGAVATRVVNKSQELAIMADPLSGGMAGVRAYYVGSCEAGKTFDQCRSAGQESGVLPRADTYIELDATRFYQDTKP